MFRVKIAILVYILKIYAYPLSFLSVKIGYNEGFLKSWRYPILVYILKIYAYPLSFYFCNKLFSNSPSLGARLAAVPIKFSKVRQRPIHSKKLFGNLKVSLDMTWSLTGIVGIFCVYSELVHFGNENKLAFHSGWFLF